MMDKHPMCYVCKSEKMDCRANMKAVFFKAMNIF